MCKRYIGKSGRAIVLEKIDSYRTVSWYEDQPVIVWVRCDICGGVGGWFWHNEDLIPKHKTGCEVEEWIAGMRNAT